MSRNFSTDSYPLSPINSSLSASEPGCFFIRPMFLVYVTYTIFILLLLVPLCIFILCHGLLQWYQQRPSSATARHSDSITYNMVVMEMVFTLGCVTYGFGIFRNHKQTINMASYFFAVSWFGERLFHVLTCVEHYLAVVHPITYLSLRKQKGIWIRNMVTGFIWFLCFGLAGVLYLDTISTQTLLCLLISFFVVVSFCCLSVLWTLIHRGPGQQGRRPVRVSQLKQKAFYTIVSILSVLLLRCICNLVLTLLNVLKVETNECVAVMCELCLNVPSSLLLPLLFLQRAGYDMSVNSSSSSSDTHLPPSIKSSSLLLLVCLTMNPYSSVFITFTITIILLLFPLCILVLYHGLQRWRQQRPASTAATHSDSFTCHLATMELLNIFGSILCCGGIYSKTIPLLDAWYVLLGIVWYGENFFHVLSCVEHYLAVVHPITYLSLRKEKVTRIRNIVTGFIWLFSLTMTSIVEKKIVFLDACLVCSSVLIISFCSLSVLWALIHPGPSEQDRDQRRLTQTKQRAFYTILSILAVLSVRFTFIMAWGTMSIITGTELDCSWLITGVWCNIPSSLILPLLFLKRAGQLMSKKNIK